MPSNLRSANHPCISPTPATKLNQRNIFQQPASLAVPLAQDAGAVALPVAGLLGLAAVGLAAALGEAQLELRLAARVEIDRERDERHPFALHRAHEPVDLAPVQQQLSRPARLVVEARRGIDREMRIHQEELAAALDRIGLGDAGQALAQHLDLAADEHHARLDRVLDQVVVPRPPVRRGPQARSLLLQVEVTPEARMATPGERTMAALDVVVEFVFMLALI